MIAGLFAAATLSVSCPAAPAAPLDAKSSVEFREHYQRGLELSRQGLLEGALAEFKQCLTIDPEVADLQYQIGRLMLERAVGEGKSMEPAADRIEHAVRLNPKHNPARLLLATIYRQRIPTGSYRPVRASALFEDLLKENPDRMDIRIEYAKWLAEGEVRLLFPGDPSRVAMDSAWSLELARSHLEKIIDHAPPDSEFVKIAQAYTGELLMKLGDFEPARQRMEYVLSKWDLGKESTARALQKIGHCQWRMKDYKAAAVAFRKAYQTDPKIVYLWDVRVAYDALGEYTADVPASQRFELRKEPIDPADPPLLKFHDVAGKMGIDKWAGAGPSAWADVDGDGREDLLACGCDTFCSLWKNNGTSFTDITLKAGLGRLESGFGAVFADYDNDGDNDFYVARNGWNGPAPNSLMRNRGDGTFEDVIQASGADAPGSSFNLAWADFNADGWLDLFVTQGVTNDGSVNRFFLGNGDGTFRDATEAAGVLQPRGVSTIGVAVGDYDADARPDVFVHGRYSPNRLYHNLGNGTFKDVAVEAGVAGDGKQNGYVGFFSDVDADGDLDIVAASLADWPRVLEGYRPGYKPSGSDPRLDVPRCWKNEGGGRFTDVSQSMGLIYPLGVMSGGVADLDNDGYPDFYLGTGNPEFSRLESKVLLHNAGGKRFDNVVRYAGLETLGKGHGISFIDWDRDGDLDIYFELGGFYHGDFWHSAFFINEQGNRNNWLEITLQQPGLNHDAIGSGVTLRDGAYRFYQEVKRGEGFGSTNPPRLHFGLGKRTSFEALEIRWPDGSRQTLKEVPVNKRLRLVKGESTWTVE